MNKADDIHVANVNVYFIRHSESEFNVAYHNYWDGKKEYDPENIVTDRNDDYHLQMSKKNLIDCGITKKGKKECKKISGNYDLIISSPMRRCLETLEFSNIEYNKKDLIICDLFREIQIEICDFYQTVIESNQFQKLKSQTLGDKKTNPNYDKIFFYPKETTANFIKRVECAKLYLKCLINDITQNYTTHDKKEFNIAIITHGDFVWYFTHKKEKRLKNGQRLKINKEMLLKL